MPTHPRAFIAEYVDPAIELYRIDRLKTHLAVHAITQLDNIAEVVALYLHLGSQPYLPQGVATAYRKDIRQREPILGIVTDAHDSHKHGTLKRHITSQAPHGASGGQRPSEAMRRAFFLGVTKLGAELTPFRVLVLELNDGTEMEFFQLLHQAREAWDRELTLQGL